MEWNGVGQYWGNDVRCIFCRTFSYPDLILNVETCPGNVRSSDVSRSSLVFLRREILIPKLLSGLFLVRMFYLLGFFGQDKVVNSTKKALKRNI